jgi:hypothetical protein
MFLCALIAALSIALRARRSSTAVGRFDVDARQLLVFETLSLRFNLKVLFPPTHCDSEPVV